MVTNVNAIPMSQSLCLHSQGPHNKIPLTGWLKRWNLFSHGFSGRGLRLRLQQGWFSLRSLNQCGNMSPLLGCVILS